MCHHLELTEPIVVSIPLNYFQFGIGMKSSLSTLRTYQTAT